MAPMKITKSLKKKALEAIKEGEKVDREFGITVEYLATGHRQFVDALGGRGCQLSVLEWWLLYGERGDLRQRRQDSCTFIFNGEVLDLRRSFKDYNIVSTDIVQVVINHQPTSSEDEN